MDEYVLFIKAKNSPIHCATCLEACQKIEQHNLPVRILELPNDLSMTAASNLGELAWLEKVEIVEREGLPLLVNTNSRVHWAHRHAISRLDAMQQAIELEVPLD